ncbi:MAG TPA: hypothetical protein VI895_04075 [Bdellovibrionota bacterium]|nr:hypothetical protein [Bdellovibrionota bacterium]
MSLGSSLFILQIGYLFDVVGFAFDTALLPPGSSTPSGGTNYLFTAFRNEFYSSDILRFLQNADESIPKCDLHRPSWRGLNDWKNMAGYDNGWRTPAMKPPKSKAKITALA